jgi:Protein of unknown function (DUF1488)
LEQEGVMNLFAFPDDAQWSEAARAIEFGIAIGEYRGIVRVPRRVFQRLLDHPLTPQDCLAAFHLSRNRFERAAEQKLRARQLSDDGNLELNLRDLGIVNQRHA